MPAPAPAPASSANAQPVDCPSRCWALLFLLASLVSMPARGQELDFTKDCMRVAVEGLILNTSPACVGAFRDDPAARLQFIQLIQVTLAQAELADREGQGATGATRSLRKLFNKASQEPGRVVGTGGAYYGAQ